MKTYADECLERAQKALLSQSIPELVELSGEIPELVRRLKKACRLFRDIENAHDAITPYGYGRLADELEAPLEKK